MIKDLIKVAADLDAAGYTKEADRIDSLIKKIAKKTNFPENPPTKNVEWVQVTVDPNFTHMCQNFSDYSKKPLKDQIKEQEELNKLNVPGFNKNKIYKGQDLVFYSTGNVHG